LIRKLSTSQNFHGHRWLTLTDLDLKTGDLSVIGFMWTRYWAIFWSA